MAVHDAVASFLNELVLVHLLDGLDEGEDAALADPGDHILELGLSVWHLCLQGFVEAEVFADTPEVFYQFEGGGRQSLEFVQLHDGHVSVLGGFELLVCAALADQVRHKLTLPLGDLVVLFFVRLEDVVANLELAKLLNPV